MSAFKPLTLPDDYEPPQENFGTISINVADTPPAHIPTPDATTVTVTWGVPVVSGPPLVGIPITVTRLRRIVRRYRKHGERRGVVRREARIVGDVEWEQD
jgi:hypothetical protein